MSEKNITPEREKYLNEIVYLQIDGVEKKMSRREAIEYIDNKIRNYTPSYTLEELQELRTGEKVNLEPFWEEGLDERERLQAENIAPKKNLRIPVSILNPYTQQGTSYTYKLENFPKKFGVEIETVWAAYLANYSFYTMGKFLFIEKNKNTYHIGNMIKPAKKVASKNKKSRNVSKKFFK